MRNLFVRFAVFVIVTALAGIIHAADQAENPMKSSEPSGIQSEQATPTSPIATEEAKKVIVARVNGAGIDMLMLTRAMNRVVPKYLKEGEAATPEMTAKIRNEALERLIFEELAVQSAIRDGINPSAEAIDKVVAQVKENLGSEEAYREYLSKNGLTEDALKKLIEKSQRFELMTAREIYGKVKVDEKLLRDEYEKEKAKFILPDNYAVEDVFFLKGDDEDKTIKKANEVLNTIRKKENNPWKLVLDGTFIVRKLKITKEKHPEIFRAMATMNAGDLSGVIKDSDGLHIVKAIKKEPSRQATFEEAKGSLEPKFLVPAQEERKKEWQFELIKDAKIEIVIDEIKGPAATPGVEPAQQEAK